LRGVTLARADPGTLYVDGATGSDDSDCSNPAAPCATIGYALTQAGNGDNIRVAQGVYTESLAINISVTLEGSYESVGWTRSITQYETIIDGGGVINQPVVTIQDGSDGTVLDGLTITGGNSQETGGVDAGGSEVTIKNCLIRDNFADGSPHSSAGGGVTSNGRLTILDTLIVDNEVNEGASGVRLGGGGSHLTMVNTLVANNRGAEGLHLNGGADLMNVTIANNAAGTGRPGINHNPEFGEPVVLVNSIIYDNGWGDAIHVPDPNLIQAIYSDIEGGWTGVGNIDANPSFVDLANGDYHLQAWSPCIDAGTAEGASDHDLEGDLRPQNAGYDMGADEFVGTPIPPALYVDGATGSDTTDCRNPAGPCATIGYALVQAVSGDEIRVAQGTYTENLTIDGKTLTLRGGYTISDTEWSTDKGETIVDGNGADRTFLIHGNNSVLENLTITGGDTPDAECWGGGVWVTNGDVTIRFSTITGNWADCSGGGVEVNSDWGPAHLTVEDSVVVDNGSGGDAGGVSVWHTGAHLTNTLIISNTASNASALRIEDSDVTIQNCTIADNQGGVAVNAYDTDAQADALIVRNSIVWGNINTSLACTVQTCTVTYSDIEGGWPGTGNIDADPLFRDPDNGDYHLAAGSPCIDAGTPAGAPTHDLEGTPRDATPDMGAYEWQRFRIFLPLTLRNFGP